MLKSALRALKPDVDFNALLKEAKNAISAVWDNFIKNVEETRRRMQDISASNIDIALTHYHEGRYTDALIRLAIMRKIWGESFFVRYNAGRCYFAKRNYSKAAEKINAALEIEPDNEEAQYYLRKIQNPESVGYITPNVVKEYCQYNLPHLISMSNEESEICNNLANTVKNICPNHSSLDVLNIGCGAGHLGIAMRNAHVGRAIYGVDFSDQMSSYCQKLTANNSRVYDAVATQEMHKLLAQCSKTFDVIAAHRTFEMFGDLSALFHLCRQALKEGGLLIFTAQRTRCSYNMQFAPSIDRFLYSDDYIEDMASRANLEMVHKKYFNLKAGDNLIQCALRELQLG